MENEEKERKKGGLRMPRLQLRAVQGPFALIPHSFSSLNSPLSPLSSLLPHHSFLLSPFSLSLSLPHIFLSLLFFFYPNARMCKARVITGSCASMRFVVSVRSLSVLYSLVRGVSPYSEALALCSLSRALGEEGARL